MKTAFVEINDLLARADDFLMRAKRLAENHPLIVDAIHSANLAIDDACAVIDRTTQTPPQPNEP
jgi:hypothetical protein